MSEDALSGGEPGGVSARKMEPDHPDLGAASLALGDLLALPAFTGTEVIAGERGLERLVERLNVMEVPDILPWVKPRELLLTTAYPLRDQPDALPTLVGELDRLGLSGLAIKFGRYLDELPVGVIERADTCGFPLLRLPDGVAFDDILNQALSEILNRQAARLEQSETVRSALLEIVLSGGGLPEIAGDLADLLGCPVVVSGADHTVLAASSLGEAERRLRAAGLLREGRLHLPASRGKAATSGLPAVRHVTVPIAIGETAHGHITAVETGTPLGESEALALENASTVAALAISRANEVAAVQARLRLHLLGDLIDGRLRSREEAIVRAASVGWDLDRCLVILVTEPDDVPAWRALTGAADVGVLDRLAAAAEEWVGSSSGAGDDHGAAVTLGDRVIVVAGAPADGTGTSARGRSLLKALARGLASTMQKHAGVALAVGAGRPVDDPLALHEGYRQAVKAIEVGRRIRGVGAVTHFDELGAFRLLSLVPDPDELRAFAADVLGPLAAAGPRHGDMLQTLRVLIETNGNVAEAARRLHYHYNTLRYRIERLQQMVGPFLDDHEIRLNLHLALQILDMPLAGARTPPDGRADAPSD